MTHTREVCTHLSTMRDAARPMDYEPVLVCRRTLILAPCPHIPGCWVDPHTIRVRCPFLEEYYRG